MKKFILALFCIIFSLCIIGASAWTCDIGRPACIPSCMLQNCATGYCDVIRKICVCSRCKNGTCSAAILEEIKIEISKCLNMLSIFYLRRTQHIFTLK